VDLVKGDRPAEMIVNQHQIFRPYTTYGVCRKRVLTIGFLPLDKALKKHGFLMICFETDHMKKLPPR
jgi:hypothetical protein